MIVVYVMHFCVHPYRLLKVTSLLLITGTSCVHAEDSKIFYADVNLTSSTYHGTSWPSAYTSLQMAIDTAAKAGGGEVWVRAGVYKPKSDDRSSSFILKPGVRVYGGFRGNEIKRSERNPRINRTVLSGDIGQPRIDDDNCYHVVTGSSESVLDGVIISNGNADGDHHGNGGGLLLPPGTRDLVIANTTFERNQAEMQGGAIYTGGANLTLTNCIFFSNSAREGGGISGSGNTSLTILDSVFSANFVALRGGGLLLEEGAEATIERSSFLNNRTDDHGAAAALISRKDSERAVAFIECTFQNNTARNDAGALWVSGPLFPIFHKSSFTGNTALNGTGGITTLNGAYPVVADCTFSRNRGLKGREDFGSDESSGFVESEAALAALKKPIDESSKVPEKPEQRILPPELGARNAEEATVLLKDLLKDATYTVFILGDLTDTDFIGNYRHFEATAKDFPKDAVRFHYIHRYLTRPENNGYLQAFNEKERLRQMTMTEAALRTSIPWLYDPMDNLVARTLDPTNMRSVFVYASDGRELYAGKIDDPNSLRKTLASVAGEPTGSTSLSRIPKPGIKALNPAPARYVEPVNLNPEKNPLLPLRIEPINSPTPFYAKLRVEANQSLLDSGNGRLYLGFRVDPLYKVEWDNNSEPLRYEIRALKGVVAPSTDIAPQITQHPTDTDPREFILNARQLETDKPLSLQVTYSVFSPALRKEISITQRYLIYLEQDPYAGQAYRRQIKYDDPSGRRRARNIIDVPHELREYDTNHDGRLTRGELSGNLWSKFPEMDTNRDGYLSSEEYQRYRHNR